MKRLPVFHPYFFAIYSVLAVYAYNGVEVPIHWVFRPLLVVVIGITALFLFLKNILKDEQHAGMVTTLVLFWFFFGHIHRFLSEKSAFWSTPGGTLFAFFLWTAPLALLGSKWAWNQITNRKFITTFLNATSVIVVLLPAFTTGRILVETLWWSNVYQDRHSTGLAIALEPRSAPPDIYLIVMDAYGREDFLREVYGFDNSEFTEYLTQKGFYVAEESSPNYPMTMFSLSSLLNMTYLDEYTNALGNRTAHGPVYDLMQHSDVRWLLQKSGYRFVALPSAAFFTQMRDADVYYQLTAGDMNEFEGLLLSSTLVNLAVEAWQLDVPVPSYNLHRRYIHYSLEKVKEVPQLEGPKFVFVHIMAPHPPFVLDELGNAVQPNRPFTIGDAAEFTGTRAEYIAGYIGEMKYLSRQLMDVIDSLIAQSAQPPIIILMGDHGPASRFSLRDFNNACFKERYSILNAYYFPDRDYSGLYPSITPVNSFRVVLNQYFGAELEHLEDRNYYSTWESPFDFIDVTDQAQTCQLEQIQ